MVDFQQQSSCSIALERSISSSPLAYLPVAKVEGMEEGVGQKPLPARMKPLNSPRKRGTDGLTYPPILRHGMNLREFHETPRSTPMARFSALSLA